MKESDRALAEQMLRRVVVDYAVVEMLYQRAQDKWTAFPAVLRFLLWPLLATAWVASKRKQRRMAPSIARAAAVALDVFADARKRVAEMDREGA